MIREAEPRDAQAIEGLYKALLPNNPNIRVLPERIDEIKGNGNSFLFVIEQVDRVIGTAHLHICLDALEGDRPFGVIERVIVEPGLQGQSYGTQLMRYIEDICVEKKCVKVFLTSGAARERAHLFYRRLGYDGEASKAFKKYL